MEKNLKVKAQKAPKKGKFTLAVTILAFISTVALIVGLCIMKAGVNIVGQDVNMTLISIALVLESIAIAVGIMLIVKASKVDMFYNKAIQRCDLIFGILNVLFTVLQIITISLWLTGKIENYASGILSLVWVSVSIALMFISAIANMVLYIDINKPTTKVKKAVK